MTTGTPPPNRPRRSRARRFLPLALAAWLVLEIWLLTLVASAAGGLTVLLILVAGAALGAVVIKSAGRRAFRNLTETLQQMPGQPGASATPPTVPAGGKGTRGNGLLMLGGLLLLIPGLISDAAGLLLLVPPVRTMISRYAERSLEGRMRAATPGSLGDAFQQARMHRPDGKVVQGEVVRDDDPRPPGGPGEDPEGPQDRRPPLTP
ncbi:FxsA family membrane protein [Streptomyces sp. NPDC058869]|uniref:FxsA family membrane protein n=1 Tax=Streptomyces sp. NPDC058869 TaxID=3346659 RepID=UPI0036B9AC8D